MEHKGEEEPLHKRVGTLSILHVGILCVLFSLPISVVSLYACMRYRLAAFLLLHVLAA